jgi:hypothetical protein
MTSGFGEFLDMDERWELFGIYVDALAKFSRKVHRPLRLELQRAPHMFQLGCGSSISILCRDDMLMLYAQRTDVHRCVCDPSGVSLGYHLMRSYVCGFPGAGRVAHIQVCVSPLLRAVVRRADVELGTCARRVRGVSLIPRRKFRIGSKRSPHYCSVVSSTSGVPSEVRGERGG